jgi:hypothetical protein
MMDVLTMYFLHIGSVSLASRGHPMPTMMIVSSIPASIELRNAKIKIMSSFIVP